MTLRDRHRTRRLLGLVAAGLFVSGVTVWPALPELRWLAGITTGLPALHAWILTCIAGLEATGRDYPFLFYAGDWLAFAHVMLAILFLGAMKDPQRNLWVVQFGLICCAAAIPLALVCGPLRGIPGFWLTIDCAFAPAAGIPLWMAYFLLRKAAVGQPA